MTIRTVLIQNPSLKLIPRISRKRIVATTRANIVNLAVTPKEAVPLTMSATKVRFSPLCSVTELTSLQVMIGTSWRGRRRDVSVSLHRLQQFLTKVTSADLKKAEGGKKGRDSDESEDDRPKKKSSSKANGNAKGKR